MYGRHGDPRDRLPHLDAYSDDFLPAYDDRYVRSHRSSARRRYDGGRARHLGRSWSHDAETHPWGTPYRRHRDGGHRRRWPRAHDSPPPERGRRWTDREAWRKRVERLKGEAEERGWTGRLREFARRYREPIIGLAMAGAAAPMAEGMRAPKQTTPPGAAERVSRAAVGRAGPIEEAISERWAEEEADQIRADTIEGAIIRYGISRSLAEDIYDAAVRNDIDPDVAFGLVNTESSFDERAVSNVGARGLTQVMPRTGAWLRPGTTAEDLFDRKLNLELGFSYLRDLIDRYDGNLRLALLAYNRGPGTVDRVLARGGDPDNGYADRVLSG